MEIIMPPTSLTKPLIVPNKLLMGPGPSNAPQRVLDAMSKPIIGHLHTETLKIMDEIKEGVQYLFQTRNPVTFCISGSGHAGMEAVLCNLIEDGDIVLVGVTGIWGRRAGDMIKRYGGDLRYIEEKPGFTISLEYAREYMEVHHPKIFFLTQGDSSTGVLQPIKGFGDLCREFNCLLVVDTVASFGGTEFYMDEWKVDAVYTGSQKVLGAPPGITPISFGERALCKVKNRNSPIKVYYFDVNLLGDYWNCFGRPRIYHHTISPTLLYGLREALALACDEGLPALIKRHKNASAYLKKGLEKMGLEYFVPHENDRMSTVNAIKIPPTVDWKKVSEYAMKNYSYEITGGLGPTAGLVFRIGLMGINATEEKIDLILDVFREAFLNTSNFKPKM